MRYHTQLDKDYMNFFPKKIPKQARVSYFYDQPNFLQGSQITLLAYETTEEDIQQYVKSNQEKAIFYRDYNDALSGVFEIPNKVRLMVKGEPESYKVMMFVYREDFNHHEYGGVIISKSLKRVIFFMIGS